MMVDWSAGHYEPTAAQLMPAAELVVDRTNPQPGQLVVDVGCGTGNAALLAAKRGATVIGVDPARRLLDVAREGAGSLDVEFVEGDAAAIPVPDGKADLVLSVFAAIFAPDPVAALTEMARVTAPDGRIVLTAWIPGGAMMAAAHAAERLIREALGGDENTTEPFGWHDAEALRSVFGPLGFGVHLTRERLAMTGRSAQAYIDEVPSQHPMAVLGTQALADHPETAAEVGRQVHALFEAANEDPDGFRITSEYVVVTARRT